MPRDSSPETKFEIGHVLFVDIVGYSRLLLDEQKERLRELTGFFETTTAWYQQVRSWPTTALPKFVKLADKIRKLLGRES